jgi:hypothetical protein
LNRGWRFCRPLPYHLATAPAGTTDRAGRFRPRLEAATTARRRAGERHHRSEAWLANRRSRGGRRLERETGFEPATSTLARSHSTTELFPPVTTTQRTTRLPDQSRRPGFADHALHGPHAATPSPMRFSSRIRAPTHPANPTIPIAPTRGARHHATPRRAAATNRRDCDRPPVPSGRFGASHWDITSRRRRRPTSLAQSGGKRQNPCKPRR